MGVLVKADDVGSGQGFVLAIVTGREQHEFKVRIINGPEVFKRYLEHVRRRGKPNAYDHANGIYEVGDRIKASTKASGSTAGSSRGMGMEYQVELRGDMMVWAKPEQIRFVSDAPPPAVAKAGKAPRPGLVSCAGKVEGRCAADGNVPMQITFRSGKVTVSMMGENQAGDCWWGEGKLFISIPGEEGLIELDLNDDGSLQGPFGGLKKKAK